MRAVDEEFSKFERKERAFRQVERAERAAKLRLPINIHRPSAQSEAEASS
jgi:hypothetical protein